VSVLDGICGCVASLLRERFEFASRPRDAEGFPVEETRVCAVLPADGAL